MNKQMNAHAVIGGEAIDVSDFDELEIEEIEISGEEALFDSTEIT